MQVTVDIPDDLALQIIPPGADPARAIFEDTLVQAYREEKISSPQLMQALGIETRYELDGFLKAHQVFIPYSLDDLNRELRVMEHILAGDRKKPA
jgi:hypothetical protein